MKLVYGFMLAAFALSASTSVLADTPAANTTCSYEHSGDDFYHCTVQQRKIADNNLNKQYLAAKMRITQLYGSQKKLGNQYVKTVIETERDWLKYRDGQCKIEAFAAADDSNAQAVTVNLCIARVDKERTAMLEKMPY